jgi:hypothetical protein
VSYPFKNIYPATPPVRSILSVDLAGLETRNEEAMFAVLQGLINREEPRLYLCHDHAPERFRKGLGADDSLWVDYYEKRFEIPVERSSDPYALFERFEGSVEGVVLYTPDNWDEFNLAVMLSGRQNGLPVTPDLCERLKQRFAWAGNVIDDVRDRFANGYDLNLWAHENLQPSCNRNILAHRHGIAPYIFIYDYVVAHNLFLFHASHNMKDRKEGELLDAIYQSMDRPCHLMGWFDDRSVECEYVARPARNGCVITCSGAPNLSIHTGIEASPVFPTRELTPEQCAVEDNVYVHFLYTDGDALWCLNDFFSGAYNEPGRGEAPLGWEMQPIHAHLAPGILQYYIDTMTEQDYAVASVSGAAYTYPNLHPDQDSYLRYSEAYMRLSGLTYLFAGLSDPYRALYWLDSEKQFEDTVQRYRTHLPSAQGILHSYGGGGFYRSHAVEKGQTPFVCCTAHLSKKQDFKQEIDKLIAAVDHRPLFLSIHTGDNTPPAMMRDACRALKADGHVCVQIDEWFAKLKTAIDSGVIDGELYPNRPALQRDHANEQLLVYRDDHQQRLTKALNQALLPDAELATLPPKEFVRVRRETQPLNEAERTVTTLEDDLAFAVLLAAQTIAGIYAPHLGSNSQDLTLLAAFFEKKADEMDDAGVLTECLKAWMAWDERAFTTDEARAWARRLLDLLPRLDAALDSLAVASRDESANLIQSELES